MSKTKTFKSNMAKIMAEMRKAQDKKAERSKGDAKVLFDALHTTKVVSIQVDFDGCGDSGQINDIHYYDKKGKAISQPSGKIKGSEISKGSTWDDKRKEFVDLPPSEATFNELVEQICYDRLGAHHAGWEINEGSYGTFVFDVVNRKIDLEYNERVESVRTSSESF